jgi:predicted metal-dependent hydrolase
MQENARKLPKKVVQGLQSFNRQDFYKAHEYFEAAWRETLEDEREFYRALIQLSGGFYRLTQNRPAAAMKFFTPALNWMENFPDHFQGILTADIIKNLQVLISAIKQNQPGETIIQKHFHPIHLQHQERSS